MKMNIRKRTKNVSTKQMLGVFLLVLSVFTYMGGYQVLFGSSFLGCKIKVTVRDSDTGGLIEGADVTLTGFDYQDLAYVSLNMPIGPTDEDGKADASISMWGTYHLTVDADGYDSKSVTISGGAGETAATTVLLDPETVEEIPEDPEDPPVEEDPEPDPPVEEDPVNTSPDLPEGETVNVETDEQAGLLREMVSGVFAVLGVGVLVVDYGERRQ